MLGHSLALGGEYLGSTGWLKHEVKNVVNAQ